MKLYASTFSHFSRKVRILLDLYSLPYEFVDIGNVAEGPKEKFGGNPLSRIPVLTDGDEWILESDHIADYLIRKFDPADRYRVRTSSISELNIRSVLNGLMSEEVTLIIARRMKVPTENYPFFADALEAIKEGLSWLESQSGTFQPEKPGYVEFHLVCAWEHLDYFKILPLEYPNLRSIVEKTLQDPAVRKTSPWVLRPRPASSGPG